MRFTTYEYLGGKTVLKRVRMLFLKENIIAFGCSKYSQWWGGVGREEGGKKAKISSSSCISVTLVQDIHLENSNRAK